MGGRRLSSEGQTGTCFVGGGVSFDPEARHPSPGDGAKHHLTSPYFLKRPEVMSDSRRLGISKGVTTRSRFADPPGRDAQQEGRTKVGAGNRRRRR